MLYIVATHRETIHSESIFMVVDTESQKVIQKDIFS